MAGKATPPWTSSSKVDGHGRYVDSVGEDETQVPAIYASPATVADADSAGTTVDPEMEGLTLFERKCVLVNRELDAMGMGRYQWCIWCLCGFGYMLDLLWAQAFGLVVNQMKQELGFNSHLIEDSQSGNLATSFSSGLCAGAFVWGVLVDIIGRQWAFNLTVLISSIFGLCLGASNTYTTVLVLTAFVGFGVGGNIPIDTTITLEFIPKNRRFLLAALSVFQPIGVVVCTAIAYGFIPNYSCPANGPDGEPLESCRLVSRGTPCCQRSANMGWRFVCFTIGGITLGVFILRFVLFRFQESPKFLVSRGKDEKAIRVLQHVAKFNRTESRLTLEDFAQLADETTSVQSSDSEAPLFHNLRESGHGQKSIQQSVFGGSFKAELARYKLLFSNFTMIRLTLLVWITYIFDYWGFTIAGFYLPTILLLKNASLHVSLRSTYLSYLWIYLPGIPAVLLGSYLYHFDIGFHNSSPSPTSSSSISSASSASFSTPPPGSSLSPPSPSREHHHHQHPHTTARRKPTISCPIPFSISISGRQATMVLSSLLMSLSLFLFSLVNTQASNIGLNAMEYFFQSLFNAVLYGWTPEAFPAPVRGTAAGVASFWGRLASIVAPLIAGHLLDTGSGGSGDDAAGINNVLYLAGGGVLVCTLSTALLPRGVLGRESY
ncbi:MFS general substrate transporter [Xylona heveae TC161]|uniref:MFS general substrate transporter n=1 Tax=Xylona heveae (strain CBS 132557 / TC161) TaxID=1328760 RepID=A0A165JKD5_XYLHT|nr:MFS general substrate transporter [Xylona heveae TC161]KZF26345.1 MFS general substrate transporter [Xylona heveae TC161]